MQKIDLASKLAQFSDHWNPCIVAEANGQEVRLAKFQGAFEWHAHGDADELFLVLEGAFEMQFRDRTVRLERGEMIVVPRGVEHRPVAEHEVHVLLLEPAGTLNTGDGPASERTIAVPERI